MQIACFLIIFQFVFAAQNRPWVANPNAAVGGWVRGAPTHKGVRTFDRKVINKDGVKFAGVVSAMAYKNHNKIRGPGAMVSAVNTPKAKGINAELSLGSFETKHVVGRLGANVRTGVVNDDRQFSAHVLGMGVHVPKKKGGLLGIDTPVGGLQVRQDRDYQGQEEDDQEFQVDQDYQDDDVDFEDDDLDFDEDDLDFDLDFDYDDQ